MTKNQSRALSAAIYGTCTLVVVVWFGVLAPRIWEECRAGGHSGLYCARLVAR